VPGNSLRPINASWVPQRLSFFFTVFVLLVAALLTRLVNLDVVHGAYYARFSEDNYLRQRPMDAPRGTIHDRNGVVLAYNRATFEVSMSRGNLTTESIRASLDRLGAILGSNLSGHYEAVTGLRPRWKSYVVSRRLALDQATAVFEQRFHLPGVSIEPHFQRYHPLGSTLCHVIGHVGKITKSMWEQRYQQEGYEMDDDVGVVGLEAAFEKSLKGQKGREQVWKTGRGHILDTEVLQSPVPGDQVFLTIDLKLQKLGESLLVGQKGVILALDPRNGEMLIWASSPGYDLNHPTKIDDPSSKPMVNRALQEYYRPGSTFKIVTASAALEAGWSPDRRVTCDHVFYLPNWTVPFPCLSWHGSMDLVRGFQYSCNVYFYTMTDFVYNRDPKDAGFQLVRTANRFGFGQETGVLRDETGARIPGFDEKPGRLPTLGNLRRERGSLLHMGIGQGRVDVTPLQMLMAYAALANGGDVLVPQLVLRARNEQNEVVFASKRIVRRAVGLNPDYQRVIVEGLHAVVNSPGGTAYGAGFLPEWHVAGKTSTAERAAGVEPDAWFIGFAPADQPELAVLVLIENGGHGGKVAAPLAAKLFASYFDPTRKPAVLASR